MALQLEEKRFLLRLGVSAFNTQFNLKYAPEQFDVFQIPANKNSDFGFEFRTLLSTDYVRFRLYCTIGNTDSVGMFFLYDEVNRSVGPGDEIYVADAQLSNEFLYSGNNQIRQAFTLATYAPPVDSIYLQAENEDILMAEDGSPLEI